MMMTSHAIGEIIFPMISFRILKLWPALEMTGLEAYGHLGTKKPGFFQYRLYAEAVDILC